MDLPCISSSLIYAIYHVHYIMLNWSINLDDVVATSFMFEWSVSNNVRTGPSNQHRIPALHPLSQAEGLLSPDGKKVPTRGVGAQRLKQQQACSWTTFARCTTVKDWSIYVIYANKYKTWCKNWNEHCIIVSFWFIRDFMSVYRVFKNIIYIYILYFGHRLVLAWPWIEFKICCYSAPGSTEGRHDG